MREFRPGSVPVFVLGGGPGAIAATEQLLSAGYGVTLVGGGEVLAGRGVFLRAGPLSLPVWPEAYRHHDGSPEEWYPELYAYMHFLSMVGPFVRFGISVTGDQAVPIYIYIYIH